ncbi:MAG: SET domain-containing protein-lysine N-methyltransferase [Candidatus Aenigmarchaeota archaeon]|nr:SET domain-containing protein-lysine N-methyltransferase [Candidatus Aenigmarchaeota archaeon]
MMIKSICVKQAGKKGKGVFAAKDFKKEELIVKGKKGKIFHTKTARKLSRDDKIHLNELDKDKWEIMGVPERFINHSCDPNAIPKGRSYFASKSIKSGQEITVDYRISAYTKQKWKCHCNSKNCTGWVISDFFSMPEKLQKKYLPFTLKFIKKEYKKRHSK